MEILIGLLSLLFLIALFLLLVGMIRPRWVVPQEYSLTRVQVVFIYGGIALFSFCSMLGFMEGFGAVSLFLGFFVIPVILAVRLKTQEGMSGKNKTLFKVICLSLIAFFIVVGSFATSQENQQYIATSPTETPTETIAPNPAPKPTPAATPTPEASIGEAPEPEATPAPPKDEVKETGNLATILQEEPESAPIAAPAPVPSANTPIRAGVSGSCDCPYDTDTAGRSCGRRSAYHRPNGARPICYASDTAAAPQPQQPPRSQAIATAPNPTKSSQTSQFNAEIFDPPSNCRSAPTTEGEVQQVLEKGDVLVDRNAPQTDAEGGTWYREQFLSCWVHESQLRFK